MGEQTLEQRRTPPVTSASRAGRDGRPGARFATLVVVLLAALAVSLTASVAIGSVWIRPLEVWRIVGALSLGLPTEATWTEADRNIVWLIRFPRALLGALVGAGLAVVGVAIQALVRNPLADPYLLGVSSGASVGAAAVIVLGALPGLGVYGLSAAAFLGALGAVAIVFAIAQQGGQLSPLRLILAGVAVAYVLSALTSLLIFRAPDSDSVRAVLFWMLGSLAGARWAYLGLPAVILAAGTCYLLLQARSLNAVLVGEDTATTLGVDVKRFRLAVLAVASILTGTLVAVAGAIGFVGLMLPHVTRLLVGSDHRRVLPVAALLGASFMIWVDVGARTLAAPQELPIGIITALIGAPFFVLLLRSRRFGMRAS